MANYRVQHFQDEIYEIVEEKLIIGQAWDGNDDYYGDEQVFKGSLADCEAWLRLNERGYI